MDRLAAEGIRFSNAFVTQSLCSPSRASFLTGQYTVLHGVPGNTTPFPVTNITFASVLSDAGYQTGYFGKWHMGKQDGKRPGFTTSASYVGQGNYNNMPFEVDGRKVASRGYIDDVATDYAIAFIKANKDKPFMAMVGFKAAHLPCTPRASEADLYKGKGWENYFQCVTGADANLGRLLDTLDSLKLAENTVVVFTSDNGLFRNEHGLHDKRFAYEESLRIPFLLRYPRLITKARVCDEMILNIDLAPTFLDLAGVKVPEAMQGCSLKPLIELKEPASWRKSFYYEYHTDREYPAIPRIQAVRNETAKLILYPDHEDRNELFDLKNDPREMKNLIADPSKAGLLDELKAELQRLRAATAKPGKIL
jgi:arylsulfatase A-like enzyme